MENRFSRLRALAMLACGLVMLACTLAFPAQAHAIWGPKCYVQDSSGHKDYYMSAQEGINAGCGEGKVVVLLSDDAYSESKKAALQIPAGQKVAINFNGHGLMHASGGIFRLNENSSLTLTSYDPEAGADSAGKQFAAGVLYGCYKQYGAAIEMKAGSHLTLDNMTLKDNESSTPNANPGTHACGGAIYAEKNCTIDLNGSQIVNNTCDHWGGGVYIDGENVKVTLDDSKISGNKAEQGGGIYIDGTNAVIDLKNGSSIDGNTATEGGGGIYCNVSFFTIKSSDGTGKIDGNTAKGSNRATTKGGQSGGGIHVDSRSGENEGLIEGLTISNNHSAYDGGGLELDQRWTTVRNCTITGNTCKYEGGGVYDCNKNNLLDGCTVTGNACNLDGSNYEGGGVYVWCDYDIKLAGTCVIKGNTRGKDTGNADDVFLRENAGATAKAYITGTLEKGSSVGVRSGITGDRRVATSFKPETKDCLFYDLDGYYISYGTDEGGDAWQRHTTKEFAVKVNGQNMGRYSNGTSVTLSAPAAAEGKTFWFWSDNGSEGLYPLSDYVNDRNRYSSALTLKMPQNEVGLTAVYADTVTSAEVYGFKAPVAGEELPSNASLKRTDGKGSGAEGSVPVSIIWYKTSDDGKTKTAVMGKAEAGTTYTATLIVWQKAAKYGCFFSESLDAKSLTVQPDSGSALEVASVKVAKDTGVLTAEAKFTTEGTAPAAKTPKKATVKVVKQTVLGSSSAPATAADGVALALAAEGDDDSSAGDGEEAYTVCYDDESGTVSIAAPYIEGYNFCNWENKEQGESWKWDDEAGTVSGISVAELENADSTLTAVYTPVVTKVELSMAAPKAGGDALATDAGKVWLTCSNGEKVELADLFGADGLPVTWSPEGDDGVAGYSTAHTAMIKVAEGVEGLVDVDKVVSADAVVVAAGDVEAEGAGFALLDGDLYLCVTFPRTPAVKATGVTQPADVELTFEEAATYQAEQESHPDVTCWPLPKTVDVTLENGELAEGDVTWEAVEGFNASAASAQELTVKGTVTHVAYDGELDENGLDTNVTVTIKVAAPEKKDDGEKKDDAEKGDAEKGNADATETETETKVAKSKEGTPSTGDVTWGGFAGLLAVAAVCLVAARVSRREH